MKRHRLYFPGLCLIALLTILIAAQLQEDRADLDAVAKIPFCSAIDVAPRCAF